jgi:hypothetical protein
MGYLIINLTINGELNKIWKEAIFFTRSAMPESLEVLRKMMKTSFEMGGIPAEIRSKNLPKTLPPHQPFQ